MNPPIKVVIVDDERLVRSGFKALLDAEDGIEVVGEATDGAQAVEQARSARPDVVLMDIRMPTMDGIQATRHIVATPGLQDVRILILTTYDTDAYVFEGLQAGASGFLLKDALADDLLAAVRAVASGEAVTAPSVTRRLIAHFVGYAPTPSDPSGRLATLTMREREVLTLIGRGRSNTEIQQDLHMAPGTLRTHINRIFAKLDLRDRVQAVILAYECGLVPR